MTQVNNSRWRDWIAQVLDPILEDRIQDVHGDNFALLSADTDRTQDYVFESERLPEIRGASMLLDQLNREDIQQILATRFDLPPKCIIYAGGGSVLAVIPKTIAGDIAREIESLYPRATLAATITTAIYAPGSIKDLNGGFRAQDLALEKIQRASSNPTTQKRLADYYDRADARDGVVDAQDYAARKHFGELVALLGMKLRAAKEQKTAVPFYESLPWAVRCSSCGVRPASIARRTPDDDEQQICVVCEKKQARRGESKNVWANRLGAVLQSRYADLEARYNPTQIDWKDIAIAQDLGEIAQFSERAGFVGLIYADGNSIGKYMESQTTLKAYRKASEQIVEATEQAVYRALAENLSVRRVERMVDGKRQQVLIHPFEIITIGGDDVLIFVPGDVALPIAARICQLFGQQAAPLSMSASVVIADKSNPVRFLRDLAQQLLKESVKPRYGKTAALDWIVLTSQSTLQTDIASLRESPPYKLATEQSNQSLWLTGRPFTLDETLKILRLLRAMRRARFPTSQLHALADALDEGRQRASLFYVYQQARLRGERSRVMDRITTDWGLKPDTDPIPWQAVVENKKPIGYRTILRDLVELYDFVPRHSDSARDPLWQPLLGEEG